MHYWGVWHALEPIENYTLQNPRFMSEFGFQSFPEMRTILSFAQPDDLAIDSTVMQSHQKNHGGNERILTYMLREYPEPKDFASFVYLSQVQQAEAIKVGAEHLRRNRPRTMGALFWQLNDCWPVASWSSIDYFGRWKALQYYARRFYGDLLISPFAHDGAVDVYIVSDRLQPMAGQMRMRLLDFSGKILLDKTQDVQIPAQSSAVYASLQQNELPGARRSGSQLSGIRSENRRSDGIAQRGVFRHHAQSRPPRNLPSQATVTGTEATSPLTLRSPVLARNVYVSFGDLEVRPSDNYFDLLPGEELTVHFTTSASRDQLLQALKTTSLTDAFFDQRPSYRQHTISATPGQGPNQLPK